MKLNEMKDISSKQEFIHNSIIIKNEYELLDIFPKPKDIRGGIYCLYSEDDRPLYLGKTVNLRSRIKQHFGGRTYPSSVLVDYIKYIKITIINIEGLCPYKGLMQLENLLIKEIKPLFNGAPSRRTVERQYGFRNYRKSLDDIEGHSLEDKKQKRREFVEKVIKGGRVMEIEKGSLYAMRESLKLIIEHKEGEERDKIIDGVLLALKTKAT